MNLPKAIIYLPLLAFIFCGCDTPAQKRCDSSNPNFYVSMLFEVEGIKVYRFSDGGHCHYFCSRGQTMSKKSRAKAKGVRYHWPEEIETLEKK